MADVTEAGRTESARLSNSEESGSGTSSAVLPAVLRQHAPRTRALAVPAGSWLSFFEPLGGSTLSSLRTADLQAPGSHYWLVPTSVDAGRSVPHRPR